MYTRMIMPFNLEFTPDPLFSPFPLSPPASRLSANMTWRLRSLPRNADLQLPNAALLGNVGVEEWPPLVYGAVQRRLVIPDDDPSVRGRVDGLDVRRVSDGEQDRDADQGWLSGRLRH